MIAIALVLAASAPALETLFPREADVTVEGSGPHRLAIPPDVLAECKADLSDLRLMGPDGAEVPFAVDPGRAKPLAVPETVIAEILDVKRGETKREDGTVEEWSEIYRVKVPDGTWELAFETPRNQIVARVRVDDSDRQIWRLANVPRERMSVPISGGERTVTVISTQGRLEPRLLLRRTSEVPATDPLDVPLAIVSRTSADGWTEVVLERPRGLVPGALVVATGTRWFDREIEVWDEGDGRADALLSRSRAFRIEIGKDEVAELEVPVADARGERLRVRVKDGDSPALASLAISARLRAPVLLFEAAATRLLWGGGRARRPSYDLAAAAGRFPRLLDPASAREARLSAPRANPKHRVEPALSFAMRAGSEIDRRRFSHLREVSIAPSADGLARVRLGWEDAAIARADFGDARVVGADSHQWPYLLHDHAGSEWVELPATRKTKERKSEYALALPVTPFRLDELEIDSETPFFDRAYVVEALDSEDKIASSNKGRLVRRAEDPRPATISLAGTRAHALRVRVEDGDDAPLTLSFRARTPVTDLFVVAPAGTYSLLVGRPDEEPARYELERVRDVVLAVPAGDATAGALAANPDFRKRLRWGEGDTPTRIGVWVVLLAALGILGALAVALARREEKPETPQA